MARSSAAPPPPRWRPPRENGAEVAQRGRRPRRATLRRAARGAWCAGGDRASRTASRRRRCRHPAALAALLEPLHLRRRAAARADVRGDAAGRRRDLRLHAARVRPLRAQAEATLRVRGGAASTTSRRRRRADRRASSAVTASRSPSASWRWSTGAGSSWRRSSPASSSARSTRRGARAWRTGRGGARRSSASTGGGGVQGGGRRAAAPPRVQLSVFGLRHASQGRAGAGAVAGAQPREGGAQFRLRRHGARRRHAMDNWRNSFTEVTEMAAMRMRSHAYAAQWRNSAQFGAILRRRAILTRAAPTLAGPSSTPGAAKGTTKVAPEPYEKPPPLAFGRGASALSRRSSSTARRRGNARRPRRAARPQRADVRGRGDAAGVDARHRARAAARADAGSSTCA